MVTLTRSQVSLVLHSRGVLVSVAELALDECGTYGASLFFFYRLSVAGTVLQTILLLIDILIDEQ